MRITDRDRIMLDHVYYTNQHKILQATKGLQVVDIEDEDVSILMDKIPETGDTFGYHIDRQRINIDLFKSSNSEYRMFYHSIVISVSSSIVLVKDLFPARDLVYIQRKSLYSQYFRYVCSMAYRGTVYASNQNTFLDYYLLNSMATP